MKVFFALIFSLSFGFIASDYSVSLEEVSTIFLPNQNRVWDTPVAESASYDHGRKLLYVVGGRTRFVIDYRTPSSPRVLTERQSTLPKSNFRGISACGQYFIQTTDNTEESTEGVIEIFRRFEPSRDPELLFTTTVGEDPDEVRFLPGCKEAVVIVRGKAYRKNGQFMDPKAKVIFVKLPDPGYTGTFRDNVELVTLNFTGFDSRVDELLEDGARLVYAANGNTFSNDVDPESMVVSPDGKKVYLALQTSNAVAVIDVPTKRITNVYGLGMKDWSNLTMDASDEDSGINMQKWPIYGYYQPDGIGSLTFGDKNYIVTANEGNDVDYSDITDEEFEEEIKGKDFIDDGILAGSVSAQMRSWLGDDSKLGRLLFTRVNGEGTTTYSKFVAFGGRSFSIWDASNMNQVYDSGDELERKIAEMHPDLFNTDVDDNSTPKEEVDEVSDKKGPEPESIAVGALGRLKLIFIGTENANVIFVYSVLDDISNPKLESMWHGISNTSATWQKMFEDKTMKGIDPEYLSFLDPKHSPTGKAALLMIGVKSNSVTLFNVKLTGTVPPVGSAEGTKTNVLLMVAIFVGLWVL